MLAQNEAVFDQTEHTLFTLQQMFDGLQLYRTPAKAYPTD